MFGERSHSSYGENPTYYVTSLHKCTLKPKTLPHLHNGPSVQADCQPYKYSHWATFLTTDGIESNSFYSSETPIGKGHLSGHCTPAREKRR